jgi:nitrous-oxide reductase
MKARGLSQQDLLAAAKTYVPTGKRDEFVAFSSGGQSGQVIVYGVPVDAHPQVHRRVHARTLAGLRLRRKLEEGAGQGRIDGKDITWGDTHHPAISRPTASTTASSCSSTTRPTRAWR